jgi:hypothetical protein
MKARPPFIAPIALSRDAQVAAGVFEVCASAQGRDPRSARAVRPSAASARSQQPEHNRNSQRLQAPLALDRKANYKSASLLQPREPRFFRVIYPQVQFESRLDIWCIQRWYASPSKSKARLRRHGHGLTLPSSGPAYGRPLKSNVRHLHQSSWSQHLIPLCSSRLA